MEPGAPTDARLEVVLSRLEGVRRGSGGWWRARCPAHGSLKQRSLGVNLGDRAIILSCNAGCTVDSVRRALNLTWNDLFVEGPRGKAKKQAWTADYRRRVELETIVAAGMLQETADMLERLHAARGWTAVALEHLKVGWDGERLTLPVYDEDGELHDALRYDPFTDGKWKMLAGPGRKRRPWPAPETVDLVGGPLYLVEGEGTAISLASVGLRSVALPGSIPRADGASHRPGRFEGVGWHKAWARRFARFPVIVCVPDCDSVGRLLMQTASYDLAREGRVVRTVDLGLKDGFDAGDLLRPALDTTARRHGRAWLEMFSECVRRARKDEIEDARRLVIAWYDDMTGSRSEEVVEATPSVVPASSEDELAPLWDWAAA